MSDRPIIIAGFGRSGTTWVSDIISKSLGGLILFEPCHPLISCSSQEYAYRTTLDAGEKDAFISDIQSVLEGQNHNPWLLRNHLGDDPLKFDEVYIEEIWKHSRIIGYKSIRWNHLLTAQVEAIDARLIYIVRHPLAVISSLVKRTRFWDEYGWSTHRKLMTFQLLDYERWSPQLAREISRLRSSGLSRSQYIALFWALSQHLAIEQLDTLGVQPLYYEQLYLSPYEVTTRILASLDYSDISLHPSYLFTPSMQTLKTVHEITNLSTKPFPSFFWDDTLSAEEIIGIYLVLNPLIECVPALQRLFEEGGYFEPNYDVK